MYAARVKVNSDIYHWVKNQVNIEMLKLCMKENFEKWLAGEKDPTFKQIQDFSKATHIPLGYFFLDEPPVEKNELIEFRTIDSLELEKPSRNLIDTIHEMENIQEWMKDYLIKNSSDTVDFIASADLSDDIRKTVNSIRKKLFLQIDWYKDSKNSDESFKIIRKKLEDVGVIVMMNGVVGANTKRKLNINEFRAFTLIDEYAPLIFINAIDSNNGRLFSLLHELAHIWYGQNSLFNDKYGVNNSKKIEANCNAIAAEIIVPNDIFVNRWNKNQFETISDSIKRISREFHCSMIVVARRALDNQFINKNDYQKIVEITKKMYSENKKRGSGGNYYNTALSRLDRRVLFALNSSVYEGKTAFTDAYRLTNTNRRTFDTLIERAGIK